MFVQFDKIPARTPQDIKETKRYGRTDGRTDNNVKTVNPPQSKFAWGYKQDQTLLWTCVVKILIVN